MEEENDSQRMAKSIADDIEKIVGGNCYYDESGSLVELSEDDEHEPATLWDFFDDALDIKWEVSRSSDGKLEVCGGRIMVSAGGPNIWVTNNSVEVYWWSKRGNWGLSMAAGEAVLEYLREAFEI